MRKYLIPLAALVAAAVATGCERAPTTVVMNSQTGKVVSIGAMAQVDVDMGGVVDGREEEMKRVQCEEEWLGTFLWLDTRNPWCIDVKVMP